MPRYPSNLPIFASPTTLFALPVALVEGSNLLLEPLLGLLQCVVVIAIRTSQPPNFGV